MNRQEKWDNRFIRTAIWIGSWSKDPSTKVGAVLVRPDNTIAATGYNGFPKGHPDTLALYENRSYKYKHIVHAEINAFKQYGKTPKDFTLYTSFPCCPDCMRKIAKTGGINRVVCCPLDLTGRSPEWCEQWVNSLRETKLIADDNFIRMDFISI
jgi:dCMP deaminase